MAAAPLRGTINSTQQQEAFQRAYLQAIVSAAGCTVAHWDVDDGIDAMIKHRSAQHKGSRDHFLQIQLKATGTLSPGGPEGTVSAQFSEDRYELFAETDPTIHKIVVIMIQPKGVAEWLAASHDSLAIRHCSYWVNIAGTTPSSSRPYVHAPRANVFDDLSLCDMMQRIGQGGAP